jgi:hypothetical protein
MTADKIIYKISTFIPDMHGWCTVDKASYIAKIILDKQLKNGVELGVFGGRSLVSFRFKKEGFMAGMMWTRLLKGRTARVFVTSDSHPIFARFLFGDTTNEIKKCILWFSGFSVRIKKVGPLKFANEAKLADWRERFYLWGRNSY